MPARSACLRAISLALVLSTLLVFGSAGWSQPALPGTPTFELPEIEVAGKRPQLPSTTPASISVITAEEIAAMGALTVADVLRVLPEVLIKYSGGSGGLATVSIRGSRSTQVLILLDGVPINRPGQPSMDLNTLPIQNVDHIEVLRGPFSAIYSSVALGGVINIITRSAPQTVLSSRSGSFGESANVLSLGGEVDGLGYLIQGIATSSAGFAPDRDFANTTVMAKLHWATADDAGATLTLNRLWHNVGTPGSLVFQDLLARLWEGRTLLDFAWRSGRPDGPGSLVRLYMLEDDLSFSGFGSKSSSVDQVWGAQGQLVFAPWPGHLVTVGAEYQAQTTAFSSSTAAFSNRGGDFGLYVQDDWQISRGILLSLGVRGDIFDPYGTQVNPRIGVVALLSDRLVLRAGAGRTFRAPSFFDLYFPGFSNPALQPETAWAYDLGVEYRLAPGLVARLTGYYTDATNLITSTPPLFIPMNVGHATVTGGSVEVVGQLTDRWAVRANYTNQVASDAATGLDLTYAPRQQGNLELSYQFAPGSTVNVIVSYVGDRFDNVANTRLVPGYWLTALTVTWAVGGGYAVQAGVTNVFDVPYQSTLNFPEPGRSYFLTLTKSF